MTIQLANALNVLRKAGAKDIPPASVIEATPKGEWTGTSINKISGEKHYWTLTKNTEDSYQVYC